MKGEKWQRILFFLILGIIAVYLLALYLYRPVLTSPGEMASVYRFYIPSMDNHFYTSNTDEKNWLASRTDIKFNYEGIVGNVYVSQEEGTFPIYRIYRKDAGKHFYTTDVNEKRSLVNSGAIDEGVLGYVYTVPAENAIPLYRLFNANLSKHFYTTDVNEKNSAVSNGYRYEGIVGYMPASAVSPTPTPTDIAVSDKNLLSNGEITLKINPARTASAIESLKWNGQEFIDNADHGRELSVAWTYNGVGECYNPTEPGSMLDGSGLISTSVLYSLENDGRIMSTKTKMAYWLMPSVVLGGNTPCSELSSIITNPVSNDELHKSIYFYPNNKNIIVFDMNAITARPEQKFYFEFTSYHLSALKLGKLEVFDASSGRLADPKISGLAGNWIDRWTESYGFIPVAASTADGQYSIGLYCNDAVWGSKTISPQYLQFSFVPRAGLPTLGSKLSVIFAKTNSVPAGNYPVKCYVAVGSRQIVENSLKQLYREQGSNADSDLQNDLNLISDNIDKVYDKNFYLGLYSDLGGAWAGSSSDDLSKLAKYHFIHHGVSLEGRRGNIFFDPRFYLFYNPDIAEEVGFTGELTTRVLIKAFANYVSGGLKSGRRASLEYDPRFYLNFNGDLKNAFGAVNQYSRENRFIDAIRHLAEFGLKEGRLTSVNFDVANYYNSNSDVKAWADAQDASDNDLTRNKYYYALMHWLVFGIKEGRQSGIYNANVASGGTGIAFSPNPTEALDYDSITREALLTTLKYNLELMIRENRASPLNKNFNANMDINNDRQVNAQDELMVRAMNSAVKDKISALVASKIGTRITSIGYLWQIDINSDGIINEIDKRIIDSALDEMSASAGGSGGAAPAAESIPLSSAEVARPADAPAIAPVSPSAPSAPEKVSFWCAIKRWFSSGAKC
jgi:hypothetical protein